jgi:hypothetical protein
MKERFMKNGVFSLEYDKETLRDMVLELKEESQKQKEIIGKAIEYIKQKQSYYTDKKLPYWVIYRNKDFDNLLQILEELEKVESDE